MENTYLRAMMLARKCTTKKFLVMAKLSVAVVRSIYSIQHNEEYFFEPFRFNPDRWFPGKTLSQKDVERAREAMNPFSIGPRSCTGRSMALLQIRLVIARVAWLYDFRRAEGDNRHVGENRIENLNGCYAATEYKLRAHISAACDGPMLVFRRRGD